MNDYNPNSTNAMFARVLTRLDSQDATLAEIKVQTTKTNGRVTKLERVIAMASGGVAIIISVIEVYRILHP